MLDHPAADKAPFGQAVRARYRPRAAAGWAGWSRSTTSTPVEERLGRAGDRGPAAPAGRRPAGVAPDRRAGPADRPAAAVLRALGERPGPAPVARRPRGRAAQDRDRRPARPGGRLAGRRSPSGCCPTWTSTGSSRMVQPGLASAVFSTPARRGAGLVAVRVPPGRRPGAGLQARQAAGGGRPATWSPTSCRATRTPIPRCPGCWTRRRGPWPQMNRYPDMANVAMAAALGDRLGVPPDRLAFGTGSVAVLYHLLQAVCEAGDEVVYAWRSFEAYPIAVAITGATRGAGAAGTGRGARPRGHAGRGHPADPGGAAVHAQQPDRAGAAARRRGGVPGRGARGRAGGGRRGVRRVRHRPGRGPRAGPGRPSGRNVVVLRTFSKAYGLAGFRVGYCVASPELAAAVRAVALPFGVSVPAQAAVVASLEAEPALLERVAQLVTAREELLTGLRELGFDGARRPGQLRLAARRRRGPRRTREAFGSAALVGAALRGRRRPGRGPDHRGRARGQRARAGGGGHAAPGLTGVSELDRAGLEARYRELVLHDLPRRAVRRRSLLVRARPTPGTGLHPAQRRPAAGGDRPRRADRRRGRPVAAPAERPEPALGAASDGRVAPDLSVPPSSVPGMAKTATRPTHRCTECGWTTGRWVGRCGECQTWGSVVEAGAPQAGPGDAARCPTRKAVPIGEVSADLAIRTLTGVAELDRVLGDGLVPGAVVLLAGEPGVGKSTLLLEVASRWAQAGRRTLYVSRRGVRAPRCGCGPAGPRRWPTSSTWPRRPTWAPCSGTSRRSQPSLMVLDSVQTVGTAEADGSPGGVTQVREVTGALVRVAKRRGHGGDHRRARDQGRRHRRAADDGAPGRRGAQPSRATGTRGSGWSGRPRTATARPTRWAASRWPSRASSRCPTRRACSPPGTPSRSRAPASR